MTQAVVFQNRGQHRVQERFQTPSAKLGNQSGHNGVALLCADDRGEEGITQVKLEGGPGASLHDDLALL